MSDTYFPQLFYKQLYSWMLCWASGVALRSSFYCFLYDALHLNFLFFFFFPDRGSVMKISQPRGISHPCLYSEMEVYPVSVQ